MSHAPDHPPDRLARVIVAAVGWIARHPWVVLVGCLALVAVAVHVSYSKLEYHTQRNDLLSADKPCQKRWQRHLDAFGDDDDMVVVVEGTDRERMKAALDAVAGGVRQRPDLFDRVFHRVDLRNLHDRALLFLPTAEIGGVRDRVERMEPLLGSLGPLSWQMLSSQTLLSKGAATLEANATGRELTPADRDLLAQLPAIAKSAAATLHDPAGYRNPWAVAGPATADRDCERQLTEPQYFFTPDGALAMLVCRPTRVGQSFTPAKESADAMRAVLEDVRPQFPDLKLGLTGLPVLENDEMALSDGDSQRASWLALLGVVALYCVVYRGFRFPLLTVSSLVTGTLWALGWATVSVGHLNILSSTFAVMLIGMGDYGVLWVARYDEGRRLGKSIDEAMRHTAEHAGPTILTAAVTTALAFFATMLADFKAVAELGWIAGWGVLFCAISCLTLMPAALSIVERTRGRWVAKQPLPNPSPEKGGAPASPPSLFGNGDGGSGPADVLPFPAPGAWLPALAARPRTVLAVGLVLVLGCGALAGRLGYDHNLLNLQPRGLESVAWEHKLIDKAAGATWDARSIAHSRNEALALKARYEALQGVGRVVEVASLVPADQDAKLPAVRAIQDRLAALPPAEKLPPPLGSSPAGLRASAARVRQFAKSDTTLSSTAGELLAALEALPEDTALARLKEFDRRLAADLAADLHQLKAVSRPAPIVLDDLPPGLRERYVGAHGEFLVRAFARDGLWDYPALERFTAEAATADPESTGKAFRTLEGLRQMKLGFEWAGAYALAAIVLVFLLDFRRVKAVLLGLFPLAAGVTLTLGVMGVCGVPLNPANMIALPLVVGVGVDYGVHVLHDYRARSKGRAFTLRPAVGRGVLIKALTTVLGFGTLLIARHRGMASLGLTLTLGVTFCMVAALVWLPALLRLLDDRERRKGAANPRVLRLDRAKAA
jgi:hopanoid biosynthesis associated RND transporter like protein HpnN